MFILDLGNDLDEHIKSVPSMEGFLRRRDLPSFCRADNVNEPIIQLVIKEALQIPRSQGLIFNTFEDLEGPVLSQMRSLGPKVYAIGPLHAPLNARIAADPRQKLASSNSLWQEDKSCIAWLDAQPSKSVIFVSIGSLAVMTRDQLMEFWYGLVNSGKRFLWVRRPGSIAGEETEAWVPVELLEGTKERGCLVGWAPQEEVLAHPSVGGFLTHSGWNSTLESIIEGVPMICWPCSVDQHVNSKFVSEVWKVGLDMKDTCERGIVKKMVREVMEVRRDEFVQSADKMAKLAKESVNEGGSSCCDLNRLIDDIKVRRFKVQHG